MAEILDIGDLSPDLADISIVRNGERATLRAYRNTPRCKGTVKSLVWAARRDYREATRLGTDEYQPNDASWFSMLRNMLEAVIPGLTGEEADTLSGNDDRCLDILRELGWWPKSTEETSGEVTGEETSTTSTGAVSSPA